jgi:hypothetical protein
MRTPRYLCLSSVVIVSLAACRQHSAPPKVDASEPGISDASSVPFDISSIPTGDTSISFLATYKSQGKVAQFKVVLSAASHADPKNSPWRDLSFGKGTIDSVPGSDGSVLLADLERALEAKQTPTSIKKARELPFTYAILGENQSRAPGGGFAQNPPGNWTAMKITVESDSGDDEGEVFLNFDSKDGKAEFSEKDPDFGNFVVARLATVL